MSFTQTHPRRRPQKPSTSPTASPSLPTRDFNLRKGNTFHNPTNVSTDLCDPLTDTAYMPRRSPTCPKSLEDLLTDASERRVTSFLKDFDKTFNRLPSDKNTNILNDREVLPVPSFLLDNHTVADPDPMDIDDKKRIVEDHHHQSDSGLGSSIGESREDENSGVRSQYSHLTSSQSAITKSYSSLGSSATSNKLGLSDHAIKQIRRHIIKPILKEEGLKEFHPLIQDVPARIGQKNILNLRDLEKTLIFLAPSISATTASYLNFCRLSIYCIQSTVPHLSERDQRLPTDRPYSTNYFLDLVEQIRRYAAIMAATREKEAAGEPLDDMDYSRDEKIILRGGLSHNGKPMQLVREKRDGKEVTIATDGELAKMTTKFSPKRGHEEIDTDDDVAMRSMARRRKSDKPGDVIHVCRDCKKEFKRPCDLTKHEKTHSRPWKCSDVKCKYHDLGWPTEKERDRHFNDKHASSAPQYKCLYEPCNYASKRESNCKQHMEKAHGWEYVRSKSNGRKKATGQTATPQTPSTPLIATPASAMMPTPVTPFLPSPSVHAYPDFDLGRYGYTPAMSVAEYNNDYRRESITTAGSAMTYSSSHSPDQPTYLEDAVTPEETDFNHNVDLVFDPDYSLTANFQQPTPALSANQDGLVDFNQFPVNTNFTNDVVPHLSPTAHPDVTLFSPPMGNLPVDETFGDFIPDSNYRPTSDFTLFDSSSNTLGLTNDNLNLFNWNNIGGQFDPTMQFPNLDHDDDMMMGINGQH